VSETRTEEPTPRREQRARSEGRAWQSRDLTLGATLVAVGALVRLGAERTESGLHALVERTLATDAAPSDALVSAVGDGAALALPVLGTIVVVSAVVSALQVRGIVAPAAVAPDPARLSPSGNGARALAQLGLGLARTAIAIAVAASTLIEGMPGIATLARQPAHAAFSAMTTMASAVALRVGLAMLAFGVVDAVMERAWFRASLRMSRREIERERREAEGDAAVKRERDRVREELWRSTDDREHARLIVEADSLAVALAYDAADPDAVPRVVAVERGEAADDLVRASEARHTTITRDEDLAAILAIVPLGHPIAETEYERIAALLARSIEA